MNILLYSTKEFEKPYLNQANAGRHLLNFTADRLSLETVVKAKGYEGISCFVTDCLDKSVIMKLSDMGIKLIALRSAGYDHIDMPAAKARGITVVRVPNYSPQAVAEFASALILILSRNILKGHLQGLEHNFTLDGLVGFNLYQKTIGIIGTGEIGTAFAKIMKGFGCHVFACDPVLNKTCQDLGVRYIGLEELLSVSDIVSLHCPLKADTYHLLGDVEFSRMKKEALLINTGRGGLIDTQALIRVLESGHLGGAGLDVYEKEQGLFFVDHRDEAIHDAQFLKLQALPNVIVTPHQAFLTVEALSNIAQTTIDNMTAFENGKPIHQVVF